MFESNINFPDQYRHERLCKHAFVQQDASQQQSGSWSPICSTLWMVLLMALITARLEGANVSLMAILLVHYFIVLISGVCVGILAVLGALFASSS